ncbi:AraC family transcriptional regulator [Bradyrhizobium guangdongense]|uniref:Transcriptional regulator n=1 Tax=Bradyrhizobium guangdongense TaxID=1325090 RepID=A0A410V810_9BRAD|nr:AraC family transcriptional regulator [Bradyrhizobium guangdongense]QAU39841.1 AraC family transcriptional regulator [Bradyrhizobium guangdongense]QOZ60907.1 AraC family transcriptional regulator [Bradyrhizobium guangdongense]GGI25431.1 transcriptional regulator [Bradyrhizobium guangdongense]
MTIDPLAQIVTLLQPTARFSKFVECAGAWRIHRRSTGEPFYFAILEGRCRLIVDGQPPVALEAGDFVLVPAVHDLVNESLAPPPGRSVTMPTEISDGHFRVGRQDGAADLRMRIGHCTFGSPESALLVSLLPQMVLARGEPRLVTLMQLVGDETRARRPARELVLERLLEVLLIEALRCGAGTASAPGLSRGLADQRLAAALCAMHARPEHPWTVAELAMEAGLSRSAFFARFSRTVGLPPMEYLLAWRMALAKQLLRERDLGIDQVAERVGYGSASAFSVAFARHAGAPPARYARLGHADARAATRRSLQ